MQAERFIEADGRRILLTAEDFCRLIRGGIVRKIVETKEMFGTKREHVAISLHNVGFAQMHALIEEAEGLR